MALISEVNRQVREALLDITESAMIGNRAERLMRLDEATERIDQVLTQLVPTAVASANEPTTETRPALAR